jgi:hypothetical protein
MANDKDYAVMIDRYVYDVTRRLPASQREDIEKELRGLIDDMLEQRSNNPGKEDVEAVLIELGRPSTLAAKYRGTKRYLIGPELYDTYFFVLKIVMGAVALGITIALIIGLTTSPPHNVFAAIGTFIGTVISAVVQAFAWVTVAFALVERYATHKDQWQDTWKPIDLPEIPKASARIRPGEPIAGIVFGVIALIVFNVAPEVLSIYIYKDAMTMIPIFNLDVWHSMLPLIDVMIVLGILKEAFRLVSGRHTLRLAAAVTAVNIVTIVLVIMVFLPPAIWNVDLVSSLRATADMSWADSFNLERIWSIVPKVIVGLTIFGNVVDSINSIVRGARYAVKS